MFWFDRTRNYDRARILEAAAQARARKKRKRAIALYRRVLAVERHNAELHARIAPLLAETGQHFDAWVSFQIAARACLREGRAEKALAVYQEAATTSRARCRCGRPWLASRLKRGKQRDAVETLLEGAAQFRSRWHWPEAIHLLRQAHEISPWHFDAVLELSRLLAKSDQAEEARRLLEELETRTEGSRLRRIYAAQFRLDGDLRHAWNWLRSALKPEAEASYG